MKPSKLPGTQWILSVLFTLSTVYGFSQRAITWKGGTPGMQNEWSCPQNWSSTSLPNEFSDVIIPDVSSSTFAPPLYQGGQYTDQLPEATVKCVADDCRRCFADSHKSH
ncbi:MAG: hypothetical protein IPP25_15760 [Saprospiraceae bacterium]|nr:hypothetical protein [Candidatus Opimibacter skivensis]